MDEGEVGIERTAERARFDSHHPVRLIGPAEGARRHVPLPAPEVSDPLSLGEVAFTATQPFDEPCPLLLGGNPIGDVRDRAQHLHRSPGCIELQGAVSMDPSLRAGVGADDPVLAVERPAVTDHLVREIGDHRLAVGRMNERCPDLYRPLERGIDPEDRVEAL